MPIVCPQCTKSMNDHSTLSVPTMCPQYNQYIHSVSSMPTVYPKCTQRMPSVSIGCPKYAQCVHSVTSVCKVWAAHCGPLYQLKCVGKCGPQVVPQWAAHTQTSPQYTQSVHSIPTCPQYAQCSHSAVLCPQYDKRVPTKYAPCWQPTVGPATSMKCGYTCIPGHNGAQASSCGLSTLSPVGMLWAHNGSKPGPTAHVGPNFLPRVAPHAPQKCMFAGMWHSVADHKWFRG